MPPLASDPAHASRLEIQNGRNFNIAFLPTPTQSQAGIGADLSAPIHTLQLLEHAARTGFDWADAHAVLAKPMEHSNVRAASNRAELLATVQRLGAGG